MPPTYADGTICYIEIPATDVERSAEFYTQVFGWKTRKRGDGHLAFDDATGQVSGTWVTGRPPSATGPLIYIMVDDMNVTIGAILAKGGRDRAAGRRGRAGDYGKVSRSGRERAWAVSSAHKLRGRSKAHSFRLCRWCRGGGYGSSEREGVEYGITCTP